MKIGEIMASDREITLNEGKKTVTVMVANKGDRPVQVGSHFHFFEVNRCLSFDREKAYGYHLDIPSGTSVRFEPGEENWSNPELFADKPQGFAKTGILTDEMMRPLDTAGRLVLDNVYVAGRNLGGCDSCFEHSGNGVALASAFKAVQG